MKYRLLDILLCKKCHKEFKVKVYKLKNIAIDLKFKIPIPACNEYCGLKDIKIKNNDNITNKLDCSSCYSKEIIDGLLFCPCGIRYPLHKTIPRLLPENLINPEYFVKYPEESKIMSLGKGQSSHKKAEKLLRTNDKIL